MLLAVSRSLLKVKQSQKIWNEKIPQEIRENGLNSVGNYSYLTIFTNSISFDPVIIFIVSKSNPCLKDFLAIS